MRIVRDYEVSIWTLQDSFITVLKPYGIELKGLIQEPDLVIKDDGTLEFKFNLPMYYSLDGSRLLNPLWMNTINGVILANMRKAKVIFKKGLPNQKIFEFLVTKLTEKHDKDELICEVNCEGLAFHELGKIGYKIALETDDLIEESSQWFKGNLSGEEPRGTLLYWSDKIFKLSNGGWKWNWTYEIQMDYSNNPGKNFENNKVYEDNYVSSWKYNDISNLVEPQAYEDAREKERVVDLTESNVYNLTLDLAKEFGIFCRYEYEHDDNFHICNRKVVYYNNFIMEQFGALDITYPYNVSAISRESDSTDLVTKLYILTDVNDDSGEPVTITNSAANKTREDYILNFDYLWQVGAITEEQYLAARLFEIDIYRINTSLLPIQNQIIILEALKPKLEGKETILKLSIALDQERISAADDLLNSLTNYTGVLHITEDNPKIGIITTKKDGSNTHYYDITELGIDFLTLKVYKDYNTSSHILSNQYSISPLYDEFLNLILITGFAGYNSADSARFYMIYDYEPLLYYEKVKLVWRLRLANDNNDLDLVLEQLSDINTLLNGDETNNNIGLYLLEENLLEEKLLCMSRFERIMGAALREGYWLPEDYNDYGDHYTKEYDTNEIVITSISNNNYEDDNDDSSVKIKFIYDSEPFDGETINYMESFTQLNGPKLYYPCIKLTYNNLDSLLSFAHNYHDKLSISFYDVTDSEYEEHKDDSVFRLIYHIDSKCEFAFLDIDSTVTPVIMVTGAREILSDRVFAALTGLTYIDLTDPLHPYNEYIKANVKLGVIDPLTCLFIKDNNDTDIAISIPIEAWYIPDNDKSMLYPRLQITNLNVRTDEDELLLKYNGKNLTMYEDFSVLPRNNSYYLTIKPKVLIREGCWEKGQVSAIVSNANTMIYLDAMQVSKENSRPKVSYSVTVNAVNKDLIDEDYNYLGYIAHINDTELKFENAYGYISELDLKLDKPWEDTITVKNYKTKFEDLFTTIVAQTEQMLKNATTIANAGALFNALGELISSTLENSIMKADLSAAFSKGVLTWDENEGLWATSDSGVVAMSGGGIFTATEKNPDGSWNWNTGIIPSGINANLITSGQLDTNRIKVYAGDELRFLLNADGLFAYKTGWDGSVITDDTVDYKLYVVHDASGLFLIAEDGATIGYKLNEQNNEEPIVLNTSKQGFAVNSTGLHNHKADSLERVAISWDGLTLRNWNGDKVFYANPDTGDLDITGKITATSGSFTGAVLATSFTLNGDTLTTVVEDAISNADISGLISDVLSNYDLTPSSIEITGEEIFINDINASSNLYSPASIDLIAVRTNIEQNIGGQWYYENSSGSFVEINNLNSTTLTVSPTGNYWNDNRATFKYATTSGPIYFDIKTIYKVSNGLNGTDAISPTIYELILSDFVVVKSTTSGTYTPNKIILTANAITGNISNSYTSGSFKYSLDNGNNWDDIEETNNSYEFNNFTNQSKILFGLFNGNDLLDSQTLTIIGDGARGPQGESGTSPYNLIITNENFTFSEGVASNAVTEIYVYKGTALQTLTIGNTSSTLPSGLSIRSSVLSNDNKCCTITIESTTSLAASAAGEIVIPITADGLNFSAQAHLTYSVAAKGAQGQAGITYELVPSDIIIVKNTTGEYNPSTISFTAYSVLNGVSTAISNPDIRRYTSGNNPEWNTWSGAPEFTIPGDDKVKFGLFVENNLVDSQTITVIGDGAPTYSLVVTNENFSFTYGLAGTAVSEIYVYKGTTPQAISYRDGIGIKYRAGSSTELSPIINNTGFSNTNSWITFSESNTKCIITVLANASLNGSGEIVIPITADSKNFDVHLTYSIASLGAAGRGIGSITELYAVSNNESTIPPDNDANTTYWVSLDLVNGNLSGHITWDATHKYLWNREITTYTDSSTSTTTHLLAIYTVDGLGINNILEYYCRNNDNTTPPTGYTDETGWSPSILSVTSDNRYLWNYEKITYTDETVQPTRTTPRIISTFIKEISRIDETYGVSNSDLTEPSTWTTLAIAQNNWNENNKYLWNKETTLYTVGNDNINKHIIAIFTKDGINGKGVSNIIEYYKSNNSGSSAPSGYNTDEGWETNINNALPTSTNLYLWNYEKIEYTTGLPDRTTPRVISYYTESPTVYELILSDVIMIRSIILGAATYTPSDITLSATSTVGNITSPYDGTIQYSINGNTWTPINAENGRKSFSSSSVNDINLISKVFFRLLDSNNTVLDTLTLTIIGNGASGADGAPGADGESPYNVILTNENCSFPYGVLSEATCDILVYLGTNKIDFDIGNIQTPSDLITIDRVTLPSPNNNYIGSLLIKTTNTLDGNGELTIPITIDNTNTINMKLTYSVVHHGSTGPSGADGYTVFLTNENHSFPADPNGKLYSSSTTTDIKIYKGINLIDPGTTLNQNITVTLPNVPANSGLSISSSYISNNSTNTLRVTITATRNDPSTMAAISNGVFNFIISYDNISFTRTFSYLINKEPDEIINTVPLYMLKTTSGTPNAPSTGSNILGDWQTTIPMYTTGGRYYTCNQYVWKSGNYTYSTVSQDYGVAYAIGTATDASTTASNAVTAVAPITGYGLIGKNLSNASSTVGGITYDSSGYPTWNNNSYGLILGNNKLLPMLIGSSGGLTLINLSATSNDNDYNSVISLTGGAIALDGAAINFITRGQNNSIDNVVSLSNLGIVLASNANISLASGNISLTGGNVSLTGGNISLISSLDLDNNDIVDTTSSFTVGENGLILDYTQGEGNNITSIANITMNENGISVSGKKIEIDGQDVWSRGDIIIMNPNTTDENELWRKNIDTIEQEMWSRKQSQTGPSDWVLIVPNYNASVSYSLGTKTMYTENRNGSVLVTNEIGTLATSGVEYTYSISYKVQGTPRDEVSITFYFANVELTSSNVQNISEKVEIPCTRVYITNNGYGEGGAIQNNSITINNRNLFELNNTIYYYVRGGATNDHSFRLENMVLTCSTDATVSRVLCGTYYYPDSWTLSESE